MDVLIVADRADRRVFLEQVLEGRGHAVVACDALNAARTLFVQHPVPLVLVDLRLPAPEVLALCRALRDAPSSSATVVITVVYEPVDPWQFIDARVDDFLSGECLDAELSLRLALAERRVHELERRETFQADLHRALAWQEAIFEGSRDAVFISDEQSRFTTVNRAACELTGYSKSDLLRMRIPDLHDAPDLAAYTRYHARIMGGEDIVSRARVRRKDGASVDAEFNNRCIRISGVRYMHSSARDITERLRAEEDRLRLEARMQQVQKLESLGVLAGGIAHDFNNLLVGILGNAELVACEVASQSPAASMLEQIRQAALRAADLTRQMLAYSGKGQFLIERVNLGELVQQVGHLLAAAVPAHVRLQLVLAPELPDIEVDRTQVQQVVMNLVTNAADAIGPSGGKITLTTAVIHADRGLLASTYLDEGLPEGRYASLTVADTGCGMDEAIRSRIFDPFYSTKFPGRGLGLAAALGIVRGHRGAISVDSRIGAGTTVRVLFPQAAPLAEAGTASPGPGGEQVPWHGAGTILVVDDEESVRRLACEILRRHGFHVVEAADGADALERLAAAPTGFAGVILDWAMPGLSGADTLDAVWSVAPELAVVLSSGYAEPDSVKPEIASGRLVFLHKPYRPSELIGCLRSVLER